MTALLAISWCVVLSAGSAAGRSIRVLTSASREVPSTLTDTTLTTQIKIHVYIT